MDRGRALARVDFNINPDFPKSAVKVTQAPFTLTRTMALAFTCEMTAHFSSANALPSVVIPYTIHHAPKTERKLVLVLHQQKQAKDDVADKPSSSSSRKPPQLVVDHDEGIVAYWAV